MDFKAETLFSLREAAVLSRLPESHVRREIERKVIDPAAVEDAGASRRLLFDESRVIYLAVLRSIGAAVELSPKARTTAHDLIVHSDPKRIFTAKSFTTTRHAKAGVWRLRVRTNSDAWTFVVSDRRVRALWIEHIDRAWSERITPALRINWDLVIEDIGPRIELYRRGRGRISRDENVLGGEPVFADTRLAVRHVGGMRLHGEPVERILEDYPYLSADDVEFAALFTAANPPLGRPKTVAGDRPT